MRYSSEEKVRILVGETVEYESPTFSDFQERELEICLSPSPNSQYLLKMSDTLGDSWTDGAWVAVRGINGNTVLKTFMTEKFDELVPFSLYSPINKNDSWKFSNSALGDWKSLSFPDATWTDVTLGGTTTSTGTQYFRRSFDGLPDMAALDVEFKYEMGIVAYLNGVEIYRDNMDVGEVTVDTLASGLFNTIDYRGIVRPSTIAESQSVLAVEIHFTEANHSETIVFDAFLTFLAGISSTNKCFVVPYDVTTTGDGFTTPLAPFIWTRNTGSVSSTLPASLTFQFKGNVVPVINSFRIWPYSNVLESPSSFSVEARNGSEWIPAMTTIQETYTNNVWKQFDLRGASLQYSTYRITVTSSNSVSANLVEFQSMVCNFAQLSSFSYPQSSYTFLSRYENVFLRPDAYGLQNCSSSPSLPNGLILASNGCTITGSAIAASSETVYQITGYSGSTPVTASLTLTFTGCSGTLLRIVRTTSNSASNEGFRIRNTENDDILFDMPVGTVQESSTWEESLCVTVDQYDVALYGSTAS